MLLSFGNRELSFAVEAPNALHKGAGMHRLSFPVSYGLRSTLLAGTPLHITAQVFLGMSNVDWLGFAIPETATIVQGVESLATLVLTLTDDQLAVIEDRRRGSDLQLQIKVDVIHGGPLAVAAEGELDPWPAAYFEQHLLVQSGQWERLLTQASVGTSLAIVVPVPIGRDVAETRAGKDLQEAIAKVNAGQYADAVMSARLAVDALNGGWTSESDIVKAAPKARDRTYEQRRAMLKHALHSLASVATHNDPHIADITWDRAAALSVIAGVAALIGSGLPQAEQ